MERKLFLRLKLLPQCPGVRRVDGPTFFIKLGCMLLSIDIHSGNFVLTREITVWVVGEGMIPPPPPVWIGTYPLGRETLKKEVAQSKLL